MVEQLYRIYRSLSFRLILPVGVILLVSFSLWSYYNIAYQKKRAIESLMKGADRLTETIRLGTHYAMMMDSREDINRIIERISRQEGIESIRLYNKAGKIMFSNKPEEVGRATDVREGPCRVCHDSDPPLESIGLDQRVRIFDSPETHRLLGIISPIYNEPGCSSAGCHAHPSGKKVLGGLDVVTSLKEAEKGIEGYEKSILALALTIFLATSGLVGFFIIHFVNRPIKKLISGTWHIGKGDYAHRVDVSREDEIGQLARAINEMGKQIGEKQEELHKQKEGYRNLFEHVPCYVTVQDQDFRLLQYNKEFALRFDPKPGDYCFQAYKGRSERCGVCPLVGTFRDGKPRTSEETGINKDGTRSYWMVRTAPIKDSEGRIVAAMEMCLDVTQMKFLENEVKKSEEKYRIIFNTIPNPVFVLNQETLQILDCNNSVETVYGYEKEEALRTPFLHFFEKSERDACGDEIRTLRVMDKVKQVRRDGKVIFVNMRISSGDYGRRKILLVTVSDITARLMAEQQLIQASKMATLGEMATSVAHELNQPLSVIKTASTFLLKKVRKKEPVGDEIMETMTREIDSHVDRASRIINHMREFGRQAEVKKAEVRVNEILEKALEIFNQQLKLREIEVVMDLDNHLPIIMADANRLEQVFINLLTNARDAIEEKWQDKDREGGDKRIYLKTWAEDGQVTIEIRDTGKGIPESIRDRIFDPFFTTKKVGRGTGLGLSISYGIVRDFDGAIEVRSSENEGSTFIIRFPTEGRH